MNKNVGKLDKVIRVIVGLVLIVWGVMSNNWLGVIGIIPLFTAAVGWCPLYPILKINTTCKKED